MQPPIGIIPYIATKINNIATITSTLIGVMKMAKNSIIKQKLRSNKKATKSDSYNHSCVAYSNDSSFILINLSYTITIDGFKIILH